MGTKPPQRSETHRIDTEAIRILRMALTADWIERSVEDRDYGIDMMVEAFEGEEPTGLLVLLQVKGRAASFGQGEAVVVAPVKTLLYARMFQAPFFLVAISLEDRKGYFVWLQKYMNTKLTADSPRWMKQDHVNIYFPRDNVLDNKGLRKIKELANYVAHRDMGFSFLAHLSGLELYLEQYLREPAQPTIEQALIDLRGIESLGSFLEIYKDHTESLDLQELRQVLNKAKAYGQFDYGDDELVDSQLLDLRSIRAMFLSSNERDAFIAEHSESDMPY